MGREREERAGERGWETDIGRGTEITLSVLVLSAMDVMEVVRSIGWAGVDTGRAGGAAVGGCGGSLSGLGGCKGC